FALAPPPATAGGGWEGVATVRTDSKDTPPRPVRPASAAGCRSAMREPVARKRIATPPAFAGEGEELAAPAAPTGNAVRHAAAASSSNPRSASRFGVASAFASSAASTGPTQAGQPALQSQAATSSRARATSSTWRCQRGSLRPTPPGKLSYRYTVGAK